MIKTAMILAAGLGVRMRPLTNTRPKPLIEVAGKSMLERTFDHLRRIHISHIVVNTHYLAPLVENEVRRIHPQAFLSHEETLLETGGGIKKALPLLGSGPFFTLNGDSIWSGPDSLTSMQEQWDSSKMDALLLLIPRERAHGYEGRGDFYMDKNGSLTRVHSSKEQGIPYVYIGVQIVNPLLFRDSPEGPFSMNVLWDKVLPKGRVYGVVHHGDWFHISTPEDLKTFEPIVKEKG